MSGQIDRVAVSRALAKAIAYSECGKHEDANRWAARLVGLLECHDILRDDEDCSAWADSLQDPATGRRIAREVQS